MPSYLLTARVCGVASDHSLTVSLEEFGLSRYEAQAYVALISRGTISAGELAYYSEIPRTKVYPTLLKLEKKRLAILSKGKPITCTAVAPDDAFDGIIHEQINKVNAMNSLVSDLKRASEESRRSSGSEEKRYFHVSAGGVLGRLKSMLDGSKGSVRAMADQWGLGLLSECRDSMLAAQRRGVDIKILVPPSQVGTEAFRKVHDGAEVRASEVAQNCIIFDESEMLLISSGNGKAAVFSSSDILGANQERVFSGAWKGAVRTGALSDMTKSEAQDVCRMIRAVGDSGLHHILAASLSSKKPEFDMLGLLEGSGVHLKSRPLDDIIELVDAALQAVCSGSVVFEANSKNITVESKLNSGHSLPWAFVLDGCLQVQGYKTRTIYQPSQSRGEKVHIKVTK